MGKEDWENAKYHLQVAVFDCVPMGLLYIVLPSYADVFLVHIQICRACKLIPSEIQLTKNDLYVKAFSTKSFKRTSRISGSWIFLLRISNHNFSWKNEAIWDDFSSRIVASTGRPFLLSFFYPFLRRRRRNKNGNGVPRTAFG